MRQKDFEKNNLPEQEAPPLSDREQLDSLMEERDDLKGKIAQAERKRNSSKDAVERLRLRALMEEWQEKVLALEVSIVEVGARVAEEEHKEAQARAQALKEEAEAILEEGWGEIRRCAGYARTVWTAQRKIWDLRTKFRERRGAYYDLCAKHGLPAPAPIWKNHDDVTMFSGATLRNPYDMLQRGTNFLVFVGDLMRHGRDRSSLVSTPKKERWPE